MYAKVEDICYVEKYTSAVISLMLMIVVFVSGEVKPSPDLKHCREP